MAGVRERPGGWVATVMGDIGEEITEIELEPLLPEEAPAAVPPDAPTEPAAEPGPG